jgi:hypothetical protein
MSWLKKFQFFFIITSGHWPLPMHAFTLTWIVWNFSIAYSFFLFFTFFYTVQIDIKCLSVVYVHEIRDFYSLIVIVLWISSLFYFILDRCRVPSSTERRTQEGKRKKVGFQHDSLNLISIVANLLDRPLQSERKEKKVRRNHEWN